MNTQKDINILLIDNYDSFTFNLQHLLAQQPNTNLEIMRNDHIDLKALEAGVYAGVVIGPGPGSPENEAYFGLNKNIILDFGTQGLPVLGVCLGLQGIYSCFGGKLKIAQTPVHGKLSELKILRPGVILKDTPDGISVMRYHSILADLDEPIPDCFDLNAYTQNSYSQSLNKDELMVIEHREHPIFGIQFHPESFATDCGDLFVKNFLKICQKN